jgi:SAM-dependent methyltransferase
VSLPADSYGAFARVYDRALGELFFRGVARVLRALEAEYPAGRKTHLDLACGTGLAMRHFAARGFRSFGVDASYAMASRARARGLDVIVADVREVTLGARFERITCLYDSLNHILATEELGRVFAMVESLMTDSSLFWFDLNHPDSYHGVWSIAEPYVSDGDDYHLEIDTRYDEAANLATGRVTGWHAAGGVVHAIDETHYQRAWSRDEVLSQLGASGLEPLDVVPFDPFAPQVFVESDVKEMFVARRARD